MILRQAELACGEVHIVTWIPKELCKKHQELVDKAGQHWIVVEAYTIDVERSDINSDWRVGGLT